ncbi:MAG: helix-turn-helix transcriptional regulator [Pyrinomonadaceae bacterium]
MGALEKIFFQEGAAAASEVFSKLYSRSLEENYYVHLRPDSGTKILRTDATGVNSVDYMHYDPPSFWENRHQVMRVEVNNHKPDVFYYHDGEELVIPIKGPGVNYDFFWTEAGNKKLPKVYPGENEPLLVNEGEAVRIQPQIPHRAWGAGHGKTEAWMITRPLANTAAQIYVAWSDRDQNQASSRQISEAQLKDSIKNKPGHYALIAWGISEEIRLKRQRANKSVADVAERCEIDAAHLSKIEKGQTNVSLETLIKILQFLDIDIARMVEPPSEAASTVELSQDFEGHKPLFTKPPPRSPIAVDPVPARFEDHFIHPQLWRLGKNSAVFKEPIKSMWPSTWIMISGRAVVDLTGPSSDWKGASEVLDKESVLHLRGNGPSITNILPLEDSVMLQIIFDPEKCFCGSNQKSSKKK